MVSSSHGTVQSNCGAVLSSGGAVPTESGTVLSRCGEGTEWAQAVLVKSRDVTHLFLTLEGAEQLEMASGLTNLVPETGCKQSCEGT